MSKETMINPDAVIVGAGPVGLWTAIQMKKRQPDMDIVIYERHEIYQRSHVLKLEHLSLLFYGKNKKDPLEQAFYKEITGKTLTEVFQAAVSAKSVFIRTNDLESALKTYAGALGIKTIHEKVESPDAVMDKYPNCGIFIAADGAHSKMREALLGVNAIKHYTLQYVAEIKYQAQGLAHKIGFSNAYKTNKLMDSMAFEYIGREKNGVTPVSLRFFTDRKTYEEIPHSGFKDPLTLDGGKLPGNIATDISTYLNTRKTIVGEAFDKASAKVSKLTLSHYASKKFAVKKDDKRGWFFVGDSAMGVPYFRSLNSGLIVGSQLAFILTRKWSNSSKIRAYNFCRPFDIAWEFTEARIKDAGLRLYNAFRKIAAKSPVQLVKWDKKTIAKIQIGKN